MKITPDTRDEILDLANYVADMATLNNPAEITDEALDSMLEDLYENDLVRSYEDLESGVFFMGERDGHEDRHLDLMENWWAQ